MWRCRVGGGGGSGSNKSHPRQQEQQQAPKAAAAAVVPQPPPLPSPIPPPPKPTPQTVPPAVTQQLQQTQQQLKQQQDHQLQLKLTITDLTKENESLKRTIAQLERDKKLVIEEKEYALRALKHEVSKMRLALDEATNGGFTFEPLLRTTVSIESHTEDSITAEEIEKMHESDLRHAVINDGSKSWRMPNDKAVPVLEKVPKDFKVRQVLLLALRTSGVLGRLESARLLEMVDYMELAVFPANYEIYKENAEGEYFYVIQTGQVDVMRKGYQVGTIHAGHAFGEITLFFRVVRRASVITSTDCRMWRLGRHAYNAIMNDFGQRRLREIEGFLRGVPLFKTLPDKRLAKLAAGCVGEYYESGEVIVKEGEVTDTFDIVDIGQVELYKTVPNGSDTGGEQLLQRTLARGDHFDDQILSDGDQQNKAPYTVIAKADVQLLSLSKDLVFRLLGLSRAYPSSSQSEPTSAILDRSSIEEAVSLSDTAAAVALETGVSLPLVRKYEQLRPLKLKELQKVGFLGKGSFGIVYLVVQAGGTSTEEHFALKCMSRVWIRLNKAFEHVMAERKAWLSMTGSPFLCQLYHCYRDNKYLYYLMESLPAGDLFTHMQAMGAQQHLKEADAKTGSTTGSTTNLAGKFHMEQCQFFAACIILGLEFMHARNLIYRDLKPENVALNAYGYAKIIDFGFAKDISETYRTFTFCGSPYYMAPEIISCEGHDFACDIWSLGVSLIELNTGSVPFRVVANEHALFRKISRGFDGFDVPRTIHHKVRELVRQLCAKRPADRLGYQDRGMQELKADNFFQGIDWPALQAQKVPPPYQVGGNNVKDSLQPTSSVKAEPTNITTPPDETAGANWDVDFEM